MHHICSLTLFGFDEAICYEKSSKNKSEIPFLVLKSIVFDDLRHEKSGSIMSALISYKRHLL